MITFTRTPIRHAPRTPPEQRPPKVLGIDAVQAIAEYPPLRFRGQTFTVGEVGYLDAIELHRRWLAFVEFRNKPVDTSAIAAELGAAIAAVIGHCYLMLDPKPAENPFRTATSRELGEIVGFFYARLRLPEPGSSAGVNPTSTS